MKQKLTPLNIVIATVACIGTVGFLGYVIVDINSQKATQNTSANTTSSTSGEAPPPKPGATGTALHSAPTALPISGTDSKAPSAPKPAAVAPTVDAQTAAVRKLQDTVIPVVDFQRTPLRKAVAELEHRTRTLDLQGAGVKFVLQLPSSGGIPGLGEPPETSPSDTLVTLKLTNVPVWEALKYVAQLCNLKFNVAEDGILYLQPAG